MYPDFKNRKALDNNNKELQETDKTINKVQDDLNNKRDLFVIKIGGNIIDDEQQLSSFLLGFAAIRQQKILVHGGGKLASELASRLGVDQQLIDGRRITSAETLKIVTMVYAGYINKTLVAHLQFYNCNAIGLSGADGNLIESHKREHPSTDYGFVGDVDAINTVLLKTLLDQHMSVVVAPITHNKKGQLLNTNADTIAQEIATALTGIYAVSLVYCFEKNGVLDNTADENSVIKRIDARLYQYLKIRKAIFAGMIPKLDNAFTALKSGVKKVIIGKADNIHQLIQGEAGTTIIN